MTERRQVTSVRGTANKKVEEVGNKKTRSLTQYAVNDLASPGN
jgi:hypothetical protein